MRSTDDGQHWSHIESAWTYLSLSMNERGFIAAFRDQSGVKGVAVSGDSGKTFMGPSYYWDPDRHACVALDDNNQLFIGTRGYFEEDYTGHLERHRIVEQGGSSFTIEFLSKESAIAGPVRSVFTTGKNLVFASAGHVICSTDSGATYHDFMNGLTASRVLSLVDNTRGVILVGTQFAVFHLTDTTSSWGNPEFPGNDRIPLPGLFFFWVAGSPSRPERTNDLCQ